MSRQLAVVVFTGGQLDKRDIDALVSIISPFAIDTLAKRALCDGVPTVYQAADAAAATGRMMVIREVSAGYLYACPDGREFIATEDGWQRT